MTSLSAYCLAVLVAFAAPGRADEVKPGHKLVGTWKLVSAKWGGVNIDVKPEVSTRLKHVTPTQFLWVEYGTDGQISWGLGGPYILDGDKYEETPEYGVGSLIKSFKGKLQKFTWKVEEDKWYHTGKTHNGSKVAEVWE